MTAKDARQHARDWAKDAIRSRELMDSANCSEASWERLKVSSDNSLTGAAQWAQIAIALEGHDVEIYADA